mmetsp:Transcript_8750/g.26192  ORF Transcript_8750/g.26192 Transcript_8750/m.26192 type:complete len:210 (+) Transcript_8750:280-909(+)
MLNGPTSAATPILLQRYAANAKHVCCRQVAASAEQQYRPANVWCCNYQQRAHCARLLTTPQVADSSSWGEASARLCAYQMQTPDQRVWLCLRACEGQNLVRRINYKQPDLPGSDMCAWHEELAAAPPSAILAASDSVGCQPLQPRPAPEMSRPAPPVTAASPRLGVRSCLSETFQRLPAGGLGERLMAGVRPVNGRTAIGRLCLAAGAV